MGTVITQATLTSPNGRVKHHQDAVKESEALEGRIAELERQLSAKERTGKAVSASKRESTHGFSTTKVVAWLIVLSVAISVLFYAGTLGASTDGNDSAARMLDSVGYRFLINLAIWGSAILLSMGYIFFFNNELWRYWHNRINAKRNFQDDWEKCEPYQRLSYLSAERWAAAFLFALLMLVIFG